MERTITAKKWLTLPVAAFFLISLIVPSSSLAAEENSPDDIQSLLANIQFVAQQISLIQAQLHSLPPVETPPPPAPSNSDISIAAQIQRLIEQINKLAPGINLSTN